MFLVINGKVSESGGRNLITFDDGDGVCIRQVFKPGVRKLVVVAEVDGVRRR